MKHVGHLGSRIGKRSFWQLWLEFLIIFSITTFVFAVLYLLFGRFQLGGSPSDKDQLDWVGALYFSFATQLTIGTNNITPIGISQVFVILQSIVGLGLFGVWSGLAVVNFMSAHPKTIQMANWAGYDLSRETFFVAFINRNVEKLVNVRITQIVKLGNNNPVSTEINPPYIGESLWGMYLEHVPVTELSRIHLAAGDGIKFGVSGMAGITTFTYARKYGLDQIFVVADSKYIDDEKYDDPKFAAELENVLDHPPQDAVCIKGFDFKNYIDTIRRL